MAAGVLNCWCQKANLKPEWSWNNAAVPGQAASPWVGTLRLAGVPYESTAQAPNKKLAQDQCVTDMVNYLSQAGLIDKVPAAAKLFASTSLGSAQPPAAKKARIDPQAWPELQPVASEDPANGELGSWGQNGLEQQAAAGHSELQAETPTREIASPTGFLPVGCVNATPEQLLQQKMNFQVLMKQQTVAQPGKKAAKYTSTDARYQEILRCVRQGVPEAAHEVVAGMDDMQGVVGLKQYATIIASTSMRVTTQSILELLNMMEEKKLITFPDAPCQAHFGTYARWLIMDLIADGEASISRATKVPPHILEAAGHGVSNLRATKAKSGTEFLLNGHIPHGAAMQKGDWVFVTCNDTGAAVGSQEGTLEAEVTSVHPMGRGISVRMIGRTEQELDALVGRWCRVDRAGNRITYSRQIDSLRLACTMGEGLEWLKTALFEDAPLDQFGDAALERQTISKLRAAATSAQLLAQMNESQQQAAAAALVRRMTLIQGPPGTGKTYTAAMIIQLLAMGGHTPILAAADSNIAVDNLLSALASTGLRLVRVGRQESTRPDLERFNIEAQLPTPMGGFNGDKKGGKSWGDLTRFVKMGQVVFATCSGAALPVLDGIDFKAIIIDEATQATEPSTLTAVVKALPESAVVLVGDHCQLPPTVLSKEANEQGLGISLFERMVGRGMQPLLLDIQYRMHPAIAAFPSAKFYEGRIRSGVPGALRPAPRALNWRDRRVPISVIPVQGSEYSEGTSYVNATEASMLKQLVVHILQQSQDLRPEDIGVISPYAAQVRRIRRDLSNASPVCRAVEVNSVDGFQGREKELIIVSTVRSNLKGQVGFLSDPRRLNVAITRARRGLVVLGDVNTLATDQNCWGPWVSWAQDCGLVQSQPPANPEAARELATLDGLPVEDLVLVSGIGRPGAHAGAEASPFDELTFEALIGK